MVASVPRCCASLAGPVAPEARSEQGRVVEIDKASQLPSAVADGEVQWVFNTSTGTELPYRHPDGYTALADTPPGAHVVFYEVDGWQDGEWLALVPPQVLPQGRNRGALLWPHPPVPGFSWLRSRFFEAIDYIWAQGLIPMGANSAGLWRISGAGSGGLSKA